MARLSPEQKIERLLRAIRAWEMNAPRTTFREQTLAEFKATLQPGLAAHAKVGNLRKELRIAILERDRFVNKALEQVYLLDLAVRGDPNHGPNSTLHADLGYMRETTRRAMIRRGRRRKRTGQQHAARSGG